MHAFVITANLILITPMRVSWIMTVGWCIACQNSAMHSFVITANMILITPMQVSWIRTGVWCIACQNSAMHSFVITAKLILIAPMQVSSQLFKLTRSEVLIRISGRCTPWAEVKRPRHRVGGPSPAEAPLPWTTYCYATGSAASVKDYQVRRTFVWN